MLIAIDWDGTITLDHEFWLRVLSHAVECGHNVIIVTGRNESQPITVEGVPVVYTDGALKKSAALAAGYSVDVWIDNEPGTVEQCSILSWD